MITMDIALQISRAASCICRCSSDNRLIATRQQPPVLRSKHFRDLHQMLSKQCIRTLGLPPKKFSGMLRLSKDVLGLNLQTYSTSLASAAEFTCSAWAAAPTTNCKPQEVSDHMVEPAEPNESSADAVGNVTILVCTVRNIVARLKTVAQRLQN